MTIRRDLNGHSGPVVLLGGYIVLEPRSATHYLLSDQKTRLVEEKRRAARHAAALLEAHQMAFFDCGTTTPWIIDAIDDALPFTGVCYSLNTFLALQGETAVSRGPVRWGISRQQRDFYAAEP